MLSKQQRRAALKLTRRYVVGRFIIACPHTGMEAGLSDMRQEQD